MMLQRVRSEFKPRWITGLVLGFALGSAVSTALTTTTTAAIAAGAAQTLDGRVVFTIPSQPLGLALEAYARISGREVLYDGAVAIGRRSGLVDGSYTPEVALQILLAGTGLSADIKDVDFFIVKQASPEKPSQTSAGRQSVAQMHYYARLQASLRTAFCGGTVVPDGKRVAARLWIGQWGQVLQVKRLVSTGNGELDQHIEAALLKLRMDGPPPADFAQPVTIVIMPGDSTQDCDVARRPSVKAGP